MFHKAIAALGACFSDYGTATSQGESRIDLTQGNDVLMLRRGMKFSLWGIILMTGCFILYVSISVQPRPTSMVVTGTLLVLNSLANLLLLAGMAICFKLPLERDSRNLLWAAVAIMGTYSVLFIYGVLAVVAPFQLPMHWSLLAGSDLLLPLACIAYALSLKNLAIRAGYTQVSSVASSAVVLTLIAFGTTAVNFVCRLTLAQSLPFAAVIGMLVIGYLAGFMRLCAKWVDTLEAAQT
jgi:hypothetical protein